MWGQTGDSNFQFSIHNFQSMTQSFNFQFLKIEN